MSYIQFHTDSGAYIFNDGKRYVCLACRLKPLKNKIGRYGNRFFKTPKSVIKHIDEHLKVCLKQQQRYLEAKTRLERELLIKLTNSITCT